MLRPFAHRVACCWMLLCVVAQSLKPVKLFSQQLPTFLLFRDRRSVAQQCWIRLYSSFNVVGATHAHYAWFTKTYGLYPSHDALHVRTLLGVVASVCTPLPTRTQQLSTLLVQQCWELLRPFARSLRHIHHAFINIFETRHIGLIMASLNVLVKILPFSSFRLSPCFFIGIHRFLSASCFYFHLLNFLGYARGKYLILQPRFYWLHFQGQYSLYFFPFVCSIFLVVFFA